VIVIVIVMTDHEIGEKLRGDSLTKSFISNFDIRVEKFDLVVMTIWRQNENFSSLISTE
jgi:hypothetical protein